MRRSYIVAGIGIPLALFVVFVAIVFLLSRGSDDGTFGPDDYSEAELGVDSIVDREYSLSHPWVRSTTSAAGLEQVDRDLEQFYDLRGHDRERRYFEFQVSVVVSDALEELEGELDYYSGRLARAFDEAFEQCALANEIPGGGSTLSSLAHDFVPVAGESALKSSEEELVSLRHECAVLASEYPTLSADAREDLIERTLGEITLAVEEWMEANPKLVVPLEYHPGANQPFADELAEFCRLAPDPQECAKSAGIE